MSDLRGRLSHILSDGGPKLFRDLVSLMSGQSASMILGFIAFAYLARVIPPADYGSIEFAIAIASFAAIVIECGAGTIGVRELARKPDAAGRIAAQITVARLMLAAIVIPLVGLSAVLTGQSGQVTLLVWLYAASLLAVPFKQEWLLQGSEKMHAAAFAQPVRIAIFTILVFALIGEGSSILTVGVIEIAAVIAVTVYYLVAQYRWTTGFEGGWPMSRAIYYLREGLSVGLSNMLWAFMLYAPMFLLVSMVGGEDPAWLGAASRLVISLMTLSFIYHFNLYPVITRTVTGDVEGWGRVIQASIRLVAWVGIGVALGTSLFAPLIMRFVFGPAFVAAAPALAVLIWMFPMRMLSGHARWSLIAAGRQKYLLRAEIAGALTLLAVGFVAIPALSATGAALALVSGIFVSGCITQWAANRHIGAMDLPQAVLWPLVAAGIGAAAGLLASDDVFIRTLTGCGVFAACGLLWIRPIFADIQRIGYAKEV